MENLIANCFPDKWYVLNASEWATWVQAIVSVATIWWVIWQAGGQRKDEVRRRNQAESSRFRTVEVLFANIQAIAGTIHANRNDGDLDRREKNLQALEDAGIALSRIGVFEYPDERLVLISSGVQTRTSDTGQLLRANRPWATAAGRKKILDGEPLNKKLEEIVSNTEHGINICQREIAKRPVSE